MCPRKLCMAEVRRACHDRSVSHQLQVSVCDLPSITSTRPPSGGLIASFGSWVIGIYLRSTIQQRATERLEEGLFASDDLRQTKVRKLEDVRKVCRLQNVVRLYVAMCYATRMKIIQGLHHLARNVSAHEFWHRFTRGGPQGQISVRHELHDNEEMGTSLMMFNITDDIRLVIISLYNIEIADSLITHMVQ